MAKIDGNGLVYSNDVTEKLLTDEGVLSTTRSVYTMWIANRIVFLVSVVNDDPLLLIQIGKPDALTTGKWHITVGRAEKALHVIPASDGSEVPDGFNEHVNGTTVQHYVYPRIALIITHMYGIGVDFDHNVE
jgi:hypothetical protein